MESIRPISDLRIQLEGKLERVELQVLRLRETLQALQGPAWVADHRWHTSGEHSREDEEAIRALREKLAALPDDEVARSVLGELTKLNVAIRTLATDRLRELGFPFGDTEPLSVVISSLRVQRPVFSMQWFGAGQELPMGLRGAALCMGVGLVFPLVLVWLLGGHLLPRMVDVPLLGVLGFLFGLSFIVVRMLGGWAFTLVPRSRWKLFVTTSAVRVKLRGGWWVTSLRALRGVRVRREAGYTNLDFFGQTDIPRLTFRSHPTSLIEQLSQSGVAVTEVRVAPKVINAGDTPIF